jgi:AraC-like DNA-binding protein
LDIEEVEFHEPWSIGGGRGLGSFYCVSRGGCRFEIEGVEAAGVLDPGDMLILLQNRQHILHDGSRKIPLEKKFDCDGAIAAAMVCGRFHFDLQAAGPLLALLPPHIHLKGVDGQAAPWLAETLRHIMLESDPERPGSRAIVDRLAQIIFIEAVRSCMNASSAKHSRLLTSLMDPDIAPALEAMHTRPEFPWTVASLAEQVCMSRSIFASRFKEMLSKTPFQYLLECRMQKACILLAEDRHGIKKIATLSGYSTEAAFTNAFKRWCGKTPGAFRRNALDGGESSDGRVRTMQNRENGTHVRRSFIPR